MQNSRLRPSVLRFSNAGFGVSRFDFAIAAMDPPIAQQQTYYMR